MGFWESYLIGRQIRELERGALLQQGQTEREVLGAVTPIAKFDPKAANELYEQYLGKPGPFEITKLGETITKMPTMAGPQGDIATKTVRTGGVTVAPETKQKVNAIKALKEMGLPISPEMETEYVTGLEKSAFQEKWEKLKEMGGTAQEKKKILGALVEQKRGKVPTPSMYEWFSIGKGKEQKFKWNPKTNAHDIPIGKPRAIAKGKGTGVEYTKPQQIDDCRSFYSIKLQNLNREFGYEKQGMLIIRPDDMELYTATRDRIMREFMDDLQRIDQGKKPKYLEGGNIAVCINCNKMFEMYDSTILCSTECEKEFKRKLNEKDKY